MHKKRKIFLIILVVIVVMFVIYNIYIESKQENILREEISSLSDFDFLGDTIDTSTKTRGKYKKVEESIKNYLNEYQTYFLEIFDMRADDKIYSMLTISNYKSDGPDFSSSFTYLTTYSKTIKEDYNILVSMSDDDTILEYVENDLDGKYLDLYQELMEKFIPLLEKYNDYIEEVKDDLLEFVDLEKEVLHFLKDNQDDWYLAEGTIKFNSDSLKEEYDLYMEEKESITE